ncbi:MAG: hypothetical protein H6726_18045 [Sandaracinaceae bacterium]|nr:hypothetical protein [Myxococcales bacterium]MCB9659553.1 hypothetical protein [Sandaracinaceae bacterium]
MHDLRRAAATTLRTAGAVLLALMLPACANTRQLQVASAGSIGCAPVDVEVSQVRSGVGSRSWVAQCEGASFQCSRVGDGCTSCAPVRGGSSGVREGDDERQEALLRRQGPRFEFSRDGETLRGVRATFSTEHATLAFTYSPAQARDAVMVSIVPNPGVTLGGCTHVMLVDADGATLTTAPLQNLRAQLPRAPLLRHTQAEPAPVVRYCDREWALRRADAYGFERLGGYMEEALLAHAERATGDGVASQTSTGASPTAASVDTADDVSAADDPAARAVRIHLDERAALLRGCAGVGPDGVLPLTATWDAPGVITVHVNGREDAAIHACATSVLRERRAPAGVAGRLIHVLAPN